LTDYLNEFSQLPLSIIYGFDDLNEQVELLKKLIVKRLSRHAPVRRVKFTRPPAPWMQDHDLVKSKNNLENLRKSKADNGHEYVKARNSQENK